MARHEDLRSYDFTDWVLLKRLKVLPNLAKPGIYIIAKSNKSLTGKPFGWIKEISYIGMTAGKGGLRGRLYQFKKTMMGEATTHGGAHRVRSQHSNRDVLMRYLYVSVMTVKPSAAKASTQLRRKETNKIYGLELFCLAEYIRRHKSIPQFNDWARSPKGD